MKIWIEIHGTDVLSFGNNSILLFPCTSQAEKFVLRVELHRWLEEVENRKNIMMDRKTLSRMLQGLQASGHCKCVMLSMPGLTNCGRQRTTEVVLLPSLVIDPELLSKVHEQVRKFDMMSRGHGVSRVKAKDSVPVLTGVPRMHTGPAGRVTKLTRQMEPVGQCNLMDSFLRRWSVPACCITSCGAT